MNQGLRIELLRRRELDQEIRAHGTYGQPMQAQWEQIDRDNTAFLKKVIAEHGWPGHDLVGEDGALCAWLFAQHADHDPQFQRECLALLEAAARAGQARLQDWAYLVDRVRVADGRPQLYGTQYTGSGKDLQPGPIEDPAHLDERRSTVGLGNHREYDRQMRGDWISKEDQSLGE